MAYLNKKDLAGGHQISRGIGSNAREWNSENHMKYCIVFISPSLKITKYIEKKGFTERSCIPL